MSLPDAEVSCSFQESNMSINAFQLVIEDCHHLCPMRGPCPLILQTLSAQETSARVAGYSRNTTELSQQPIARLNSIIYIHCSGSQGHKNLSGYPWYSTARKLTSSPHRRGLYYFIFHKSQCLLVFTPSSCSMIGPSLVSLFKTAFVLIFFPKFSARRKGWSHCTSHSLPCVGHSFSSTSCLLAGCVHQGCSLHTENVASGGSAVLSPALPPEMLLCLSRVLKLSQLSY